MDFARARRFMVDGQLRPNQVQDPRLLAAFGDLALNKVVNDLPVAAEAAMTGQRPGQRQGKGAHGAGGDKGKGFMKCLTDHARLCPQINAKDGLANDTHGQARHLVIDVEWLAGQRGVLPAVNGAFNRIDHDIDKLGRRARREGGLHETPLLTPQIAIAGDQPLADQQAKAVVAIALDVIIRVAHQDMMDMLRLDDKIEMERPQLDMTKIAKVAPQVNKIKEDVALGVDPKDAADQGETFWARRLLQHRKYGHAAAGWGCHKSSNSWTSSASCWVASGRPGV